MPATLSFFDMEVSVTPPTGHLQPVPITLGANWQPNDVRMMFIFAAGKGSSGEMLEIPMLPDPPTGFTSAYSVDPTQETQGVYYRRLASGDGDTSVVFPKPPSWNYFMLATLTVRGVDPAVAPVAGAYTATHTTEATTLATGSVTVPAAGSMVLFLGTASDPLGGTYAAWPVATGVPAGWTPLVATDKSGATFYQYDTNPSLNLVGKSYASSGSTGSVSFPCGAGNFGFATLYAFVRPAPDVSVAIGAA